MLDDTIEFALENATLSKDVVVWKGLRDGEPAIAVREDDGVIRVYPLIPVMDCLWRTPHFDMPVPSWATELEPRDRLAAAAVEMDGRRRDAITEIGTVIRRLRQAHAATKNGDLVEIKRLIEIAGLRARLVVADLDKR